MLYHADQSSTRTELNQQQFNPSAQHGCDICLKVIEALILKKQNKKKPSVNNIYIFHFLLGRAVVK